MSLGSSGVPLNFENRKYSARANAATPHGKILEENESKNTLQSSVYNDNETGAEMGMVVEFSTVLFVDDSVSSFLRLSLNKIMQGLL